MALGDDTPWPVAPLPRSPEEMGAPISSLTPVFQAEDGGIDPGVFATFLEHNVGERVVIETAIDVAGQKNQPANPRPLATQLERDVFVTLKTLSRDNRPVGRHVQSGALREPRVPN